ncbi:MAG TPA: hypothetical protein VGU65_14650 [Frateuria sp.]|uniref:hypothetical protein n=1 Tax=Frateuria sp. TaxID=2211372 RepID=UPI002DEFD3CF|nr:hypothetical protein [Frateuria sp.]
MLRRLREAAAEAPGTDWRCVIDGMRPINARLWQRLSQAQRGGSYTMHPANLRDRGRPMGAGRPGSITQRECAAMQEIRVAAHGLAGSMSQPPSATAAFVRDPVRFGRPHDRQARARPKWKKTSRTTTNA